MGLFTGLPLTEAQRLGAEYGLRVVRVEPLAAGSINSNFRLWTADGTAYFARIYEEQGHMGAANELRLLKALAERGVPTTRPLERQGGGPGEFQGKPFAIYPWVEGQILCQRWVTAGHCRSVGANLGRLHRVSAAFGSLPQGRFEVANLFVRLEQIEATSPPFSAAASDIRARLTAQLTRRSDSLPSGLTHGDLFRDNVLWRDGRIAALIDFESAGRGSFVYDLMVCVHAWCYGEQFDLELVRAMIQGYCSERALSAGEQAAMPVEGAIAALRFATTRITDFSLRAPPGQPPGRDYRRFMARQEALQRGDLAEALRM